MNEQAILPLIFTIIVSMLTAIPIYVLLRQSREQAEENTRIAERELNNVVLSRLQEEEKYGRHEVTTVPMSKEDIDKIDFGPAAYNNVVTGEYNVVIGYTDVDGRVPESPVMIGGVKCEYCGRINSIGSYYCDGCQAPLDERQAKADRIALRY